MRILVTGGKGFIGGAIAAALLDRGHVVATFDRRDGFDVRDAEQVQGAVLGADAVVHLAGVLGTSELLDDIDTAIDVNIRGTVNVLDACHELGARYIGITMPDCWPSVYQATKLAAVRIAEAYENAYGLSVAHLRTYNVYGPGQAHGQGHPQKILPTFATCAWHGVPLPIWGDGSNTVDLVHVDDVARMFVDVVEDESITGTHDCGTGFQYGVVDVARDVCAAAGVPAVLEFLPMRPGELPNTKLCASPGAVKLGTPHRQDAERFTAAVRSYNVR